MAASVYPLDNCLHPIKVVKDGVVNYYRCGHCSLCRCSAISRWRSRLVSHIECGLYITLFITLTYSNKHLPLVHLGDDNRIIDITHTRFNRGKFANGSFVRESVLDTKQFSRHSNLLDYVFPNDIPHWVISRHNDNYTFDDSNTFAICLRSDIQNFIKKLRRLISSHDSLAGECSEIGYFICSEYGPETFRPHYHGLLFFRSPLVAKLCNDSLINEAWGKQAISSNTDESKVSQYVNTANVASYVSKYVTVDDSLSRSVFLPAFQPFHLQSTRTPIGSLSAVDNLVYDSIDKNTPFRVRTFIDSKTHEVVTYDEPYNLSFWRRYFPYLPFRNLISPFQLREIFIFLSGFSDVNELPNYYNYLRSHYGLDTIYDDTQRFKLKSLIVRERYNPIDGDKIYYMPTPDTLWRGLGASRPWSEEPSIVLTRSCRFKITPSDVFKRLYGHIPFKYLLLGIPRMRSFCRAVVRIMNSPDFLPLRNPLDFYNYYVSHETVLFNFKIRSFYNSCNDYLARQSFVFTPQLCFYLYPSLRESLPEELSLLTLDEYTYYDNYLYDNFGLSLSDFYVDDNLLKPSDYSDPFLNDAYFRARCTLLDFKSLRKYNHDLLRCC